MEDLRDQEFALAQGRQAQAQAQLDAIETHYRQTVAARPIAGGEGAEPNSRGASGEDPPGSAPDGSMGPHSRFDAPAI